MKIVNLLFSKARPMQLHAHLESLMYYMGSNDFQTLIITDKETDEYKQLRYEFDWPLWYYESDYGSLDSLIRSILTQNDEIKPDDIILFSVDDLVYFREINRNIIGSFVTDPEILGFSLRLGTNILPYHEMWNKSQDKRFVKFNWLNKPGHYGYPFDLSNSAYRVSLVREILDHSKEIRVPNDLESYGVQYCMNYKTNQPFIMMVNGPNYSSCVDINRTQQLYPNRIQGDERVHSVENLRLLYNDGYRINWKNYHHLMPTDVFLGQTNLELIKI